MADKDRAPNIAREGWRVEKVAGESANESPDDITRKMLRGKSTSNTAGDSSDIAGGPDPRDTPEGRERAKVKNPVRRHRG